MSENNDLGDKPEDPLNSGNDKANDFNDDAKKTTNGFEQSVNEALNELGGENKKILVGLLAIFVGYLGIHKFVLGYTKEGIIQLIASFVTCGIASIIPFIEGIIYLTKSDEEFYATYQVGRKPWF